MKRKPKREPMWRRYLRFFGPDVDGDVNDELADHLARLEEDLRAAGKQPDEIADLVRARFGDVDAIRARLRRDDGRRLTLRQRIEAFGNLGQDVGYAVRRLNQRPGFTAAVVVVLALGVGATTAMFSAVDAAMLRPLPFARADRLVLVNSVYVPFDEGLAAPPPTYHYPDVNDIAAMRATFSGVASYAAGGLNLADPGNPIRVQVGVVTPSFFATLGVMPSYGRPFSSAEGAPRGPAAVILSDALWRGHYGARPMLDRLISLSGRSYTVVGIMPPGFSFPSRSELWIPMTNPMTSDVMAAFRNFIAPYTLARLADGVDVATADLRLADFWTRTAHAGMLADSATRPMFNGTIADLRAGGFTTPLQDSLVGDRRTGLLILLGATGLLLLIACANVTNLLLSQAALRTREIAVRAVLGATRRRIVRQLLVESVLLASAGVALGIGLAPIVLRAVGTIMPARLAGLAPAEIDGRVLGFAAALALITGVGFGLWPALGASRADPAEAMKAGGRGATTGGAGRARRALVTAELALTVLLLVGAGLMLRSFADTMRVDAGIEPQQVATLEIAFGNDVPSVAARRVRLDAIVARVASSPGITGAGVVNDLPLGALGGVGVAVRPEGAPWGSPRTRRAALLYASGGYFRAMGIAMVRGRTFTAADDSTAPKVAIISHSLAAGLWPGQDPIGRRFPFMQLASFVTVVGVVADVREFHLDEAPSDQLYLPVGQQGSLSDQAIVARGSLPAGELLARLRDAVQAVDPAQAVYRVRMMADVVRASVAARRTNTILVALFGGLALLLSALGVYGVVAYSVAQRRRELGIRAALGGSRRDLMTLVAGEMVWVAVIGLGVGLGGAWAAARVLASLLYGVGAHDPATYLLAPVALLVPVVIATLVPARRAANTNPIDVMREG